MFNNHREKFTQFKVIDAKSSWSKFHTLIECPMCQDATGHSGLFSDDSNEEIMTFDGYCFKCAEYFSIDTPEARLQVKANRRRIPGTRRALKNVNYPKMDRTNNLVRTMVTAHVKNAKAKTIQYLLSRGYEKDYVNHLVNVRGYSWHEPSADPQYILNAYDMAAGCRRVKFNGTAAQTVTRHRLANPSISGLLIPLYYSKYKIGYQIRNADNNADTRYMLYCFPAKELSKRQREERFMPNYTYLEEKPSKEEITGSDEIYLVEGPLKAEAVNYYFNRRAIGVCGTKAFQSEEVQAVLLANKDRKIIVAPDRDYKTQFGVAYAYAKLFAWLSANLFDYEVVEWAHPEQVIDDTLKGIDDAIVQDQMDSMIGFSRIGRHSAFLKLEKRGRYRWLRKMAGVNSAIKPGVIISEDMLDLVSDLVIKDDTDILAKADQIYDLKDRADVTMQATADHKLVVDISPTGSGKTHGVGLLNVDVFNEVMLENRVYNNPKYASTKQINMFDHGKPAALKLKEFQDEAKANGVKRLLYVSQSPINNDVHTLNAWTLMMGRNAAGWTFDPYLNKFRNAKDNEPVIYQANCPQADNIIKLRQNRQVLHIKRDICERCPIKQTGCSYLEAIDKNAKSKYHRVSQSSMNVKEGDVLILDDPASMEFFNTVNITNEDIARLLEILDLRGKWKSHKILLQQLLMHVFEEVKKGTHLSDIYATMDKSGQLDRYPISKWLSLPEPDKVPTQKIKLYSSGNMEFPDKYRSFEKLQRWLFIFLQVFIGNQVGKMYYDSLKATWTLKGLDPEFKDKFDKSSGTIILDATANKEHFENIFGAKPYIISAAGDPTENITISMVEGFKNTYKKGLYFDNAIDVKAKAEYINEYARNADGPVGLITYKTLYDGEMKDVWDPNLVKGYWFFTERSSNAFYEAGCTTLFLLGMPIAPPDAVAAEVDSRGERVEALVARPYGPVKEDGTRDYIITKDYADKKTRDLIWYKRASAYVQALGRLRSLQRPGEKLRLIIMDKVPLPFRVDEIITVGKEELKDRLSLAANEFRAKMNYLGGLVKFVKSVETRYEGAFHMEAMHYINASVNAKSLFTLGCSTARCQSYTEIYEVLEAARLNLEANPDLVLNKFMGETAPEPTDNIVEMSPLQRARTRYGMPQRAVDLPGSQGIS